MMTTRKPVAILQVFASWRMAVVLLTGFACGLPNALTSSTLVLWLAKSGVNVKAISLFALVGLPYSFKFLWSPLMDRFTPPFMGRRRGWMVISQVALMAGIAAMAFVGPGDAWMLALIALGTAFFSASQDIVVDAYRTELLDATEVGAGSGLYILGYRLGLVVSMSVVPMLAFYFSWRLAYLLMAGAMLIGVVAAVFAPEPKLTIRPPRTMDEAIIRPFVEFLRRSGAVEMLLFILVFKIDWMMVKGMMPKLIADLGFTANDFGRANVLGLVTSIAGSAIGGIIITAIGVRRSLWTFGLLQSFAGISFTLLAWIGKSYAMMYAAVGVENLCSGMATAAFVAFLMSVCSKRFTATQYALLSSLMALGGTLAVAPAGWIIVRTGWAMYFVIATVIAVPGLLLLLRFRHWQDGTAEEDGLTAAGSGAGR
ncbi:MAG: MFS transporter [Phycisphaerae bacterium]|nr:MFS transporter [Phycisphaerae bacterium]